MSETKIGVDRSPPLAVFHYAESYWKAAHHLALSITNENLELRFESPIHYLLLHSLELVLKAYLIAKGVSSNELKSKYSHNLSTIFDKCVVLGFILPKYEEKEVRNTIKWLSHLGKSQQFRYISIGFTQIPVLSELDSFVEQFIVAARPDCQRWE